MKITARTSGGFDGRATCYQLDTEKLSSGKLIETLLHQLDFFNASPGCPVGADIPRWEISAADGSRQHTVTLADDGSASSAEWQPLLAHLRGAA
jgi:hypothetical protein